MISISSILILMFSRLSKIFDNKSQYILSLLSFLILLADFHYFAPVNSDHLTFEKIFLPVTLFVTTLSCFLKGERLHESVTPLLFLYIPIMYSKYMDIHLVTVFIWACLIFPSMGRERLGRALDLVVPFVFFITHSLYYYGLKNTSNLHNISYFSSRLDLYKPIVFLEHLGLLLLIYIVYREVIKSEKTNSLYVSLRPLPVLVVIKLLINENALLESNLDIILLTTSFAFLFLNKGSHLIALKGFLFTYCLFLPFTYFYFFIVLITLISSSVLGTLKNYKYYKIIYENVFPLCSTFLLGLALVSGQGPVKISFLILILFQKLTTFKIRGVKV